MKKYILLSALIATSLIAKSQVNFQFKNNSKMAIIVEMGQRGVKDTIAANAVGKWHTGLGMIASNDEIFISPISGGGMYQLGMNRRHADTVYYQGNFIFNLWYNASKKMFLPHLKPLQ